MNVDNEADMMCTLLSFNPGSLLKLLPAHRFTLDGWVVLH